MRRRTKAALLAALAALLGGWVAVYAQNSTLSTFRAGEAAVGKDLEMEEINAKHREAMIHKHSQQYDVIIARGTFGPMPPTYTPGGPALTPNFNTPTPQKVIGAVTPTPCVEITCCAGAANIATIHVLAQGGSYWELEGSDCTPAMACRIDTGASNLETAYYVQTRGFVEGDSWQCIQQP